MNYYLKQGQDICICMYLYILFFILNGNCLEKIKNLLLAKKGLRTSILVLKKWNVFEIYYIDNTSIEVFMVIDVYKYRGDLYIYRFI